jgi:predicted DNA-binding transcriptional regulator YafY
MRRADRLFQIVQYLRAGRLLTAQKLAERLEVSERTVYRDIADLQASGVPIDGEAGVGYLMREGYDLPPLMFNRDEITALVAGARIVRAWGGTQMAAAARSAMEKIEVVLPEKERRRAASIQIHAFDASIADSVRRMLDRINQAIEARQLLRIDYADAGGDATTRDIEPLCLLYWGKVWTAIAWCRLRTDFRMFRVDRIAGMTELDENFPVKAGRGLDDFFSAMPEWIAPPQSLG